MARSDLNAQHTQQKRTQCQQTTNCSLASEHDINITLLHYARKGAYKLPLIGVWCVANHLCIA